MIHIYHEINDKDAIHNRAVILNAVPIIKLVPEPKSKVLEIIFVCLEMILFREYVLIYCVKTYKHVLYAFKKTLKFLFGFNLVINSVTHFIQLKYFKLNYKNSYYIRYHFCNQFYY